MNKAKVIEGIAKAIEGLTLISNALSEEGDAVVVNMNAPVEAPVDTSETSDTPIYDMATLKSMKYNEFKKLAAGLGVKCTGTRDEILDRIVALGVVVDAETTEEPVEEEAPVEEAPKTDKPKKKVGKKTEPVEETEEDEFDALAKEVAEGTPVEDIIATLAEVDIKATKKNAVSKLAEALRSGAIVLEDDEEEDDEEEADEEPVEEEEADEELIEADSYFSQYDPKGYNDPANMTDERKDAIYEKMDEILTAVSEEELTIKDINAYIASHATDEELELLEETEDEDEKLKMYMELIKRTIDNDGEEHEDADPYELGEYDMCCGHELKYIKKTKKYVCECCGTEYEAE